MSTATEQRRSQSAFSSKRFDTLHKEWTALIFRSAELVDALAAGDVFTSAELNKVRAKRDAIKTELRRRDPAFDRWEC